MTRDEQRRLEGMARGPDGVIDMPTYRALAREAGVADWFWLGALTYDPQYDTRLKLQAGEFKLRLARLFND